MILDFHYLPGRGVKETLNIATVLMPLPLEYIEELGLGEWQQTSSSAEEGEIISELEYQYAGRVIAKRQENATGGNALQAMVEAVKSEKYLPGFYQQRWQQIEHWKLFVQLNPDHMSHDNLTLGESSEDCNVLFESWFTEQLDQLGVETLGDLELFTGDDFPFDGIPEWEYAEFAELYPFELALSALNLTVEYEPKKKLVYVVYANGLRKTDPKRWELPRWNGWRIQYKKASRIVDIR